MVTQQDGTPSGSWHIAGIVEARTGLAGLALAADRPHEAVLHYTEGLDVLDGFAEGDADSGFVFLQLLQTRLKDSDNRPGAPARVAEVLRDAQAIEGDDAAARHSRRRARELRAIFRNFFRTQFGAPGGITGALLA